MKKIERVPYVPGLEAEFSEPNCFLRRQVDHNESVRSSFDGVLDRLAKKGVDSSLRYVVSAVSSGPEPGANDAHDSYALQLLTPASILAKLAGRNEVQLEDIDEMGELFLDAKTSANIINTHQESKEA